MRRRALLGAIAATAVAVPLAPLLPDPDRLLRKVSPTRYAVDLPITDAQLEDALYFRRAVATLTGVDPEFFPVPAPAYRAIREAFYARDLRPRLEAERERITLFGMEIVPIEEAKL